MGKRSSAIVFFGLIAFNVWYLSLIRIWTPPTVMESLHLGTAVVDTFKPFDPRLEPSGASYDSQYTYAILYDPLLLHRRYLNVIDNPRYRYTRILLPWIVDALAAGQPHRFPIVLFGVNITAYLVGALFVGLLAKEQTWSYWVVFGYLTLSGVVFTTFWNLTEPLALCFTLAGLYAWITGRRITGLICLACAILAREVSVITLCGLVAYEISVKREKIMPLTFQMIAAIFPLIAWKYYVSIRISSMPAVSYWPAATPGIGRFTFPFAAMWMEGKYAWLHLTTHTEAKRTLGILFMTFPLTVISLAAFIKTPKTLWSFLVVTQALFLIVLRGDLWNYYAGSVRIVICLYLFTLFWCADMIKPKSIL